MAKLNITQAAKTADVHRSTLQRHIKQGKVSYELDDKGDKCIDVAELQRVYGALKSSTTPKTDAVHDAELQHAASHTTEILQQQLQNLELQIEELKKDKDEYRREKEKLLTFLERSQLQLEDLRNREPVREKPVEVPPENNRLLVGGLVTAIVILLIIIAFTAPRIDKFYGLGLFSPDFHAWIETLVGKLF